MADKYRQPVGRNSPPVRRQFGQGQKRGKGRPRGATGMKTVVQNLARLMHHVPQYEHRITTVDLLLLQLRIIRLKGEVQRQLFREISAAGKRSWRPVSGAGNYAGGGLSRPGNEVESTANRSNAK
jgi:hypothetical protein